MHSLLRLVVVGGILGEATGAVLRAPAPAITPAPTVEDVEVLVGRQDPDAIALAQILLTAVPESLRQIAATNLPAVSSILWEEFLDDNRPEWFLELPEDIQSYLIKKFGPQTAWPTEPPASSGAEVSASVTASATDSQADSSFLWPTGTSQPASQTGTEATASESTAETASSDLSSFTTSVSATSKGSTSDASHSRTIASSINQAQPSSTPSTTESSAPPASDSGLSRNQKIGLGVGLPLGLLGAAALFFGCCTLLRRRQKKNVNGSVPPSSPGFIPRFAFQERSTENLEHRTPLTHNLNRSTHDFGGSTWEDEGVDPTETAYMHNPYTMNNPYTLDPRATQQSNMVPTNDAGPSSYSNTPMTMSDPQPVMAPALYHTHSSNRARGMRTSYSSLTSVAEVTEPDEELESPILGRNASQNHGKGRSLIPAAVAPAMAQIKRKPVPKSPPSIPASPAPVATSPAAHAASQKLLRQTMPEHSGSSSSGLGLSSLSGFNTSSSSGLGGYAAEPTSPVSPISNRANSNPFNYDTYVEDYGPEYHSGYTNIEDGPYGGNTNLSYYPETPRRKSSRGEWPLRNIVGSGHRRKSSPLWDRIYEE